MKHKAIFISSILLLNIIACTCIGQDSFKYAIKGDIQGLKNDSVILFIRHSGNFDEGTGVDTMFTTGENDNFSFNGQLGQPAIAYVMVGGMKAYYDNFIFFIEKGEILIKGNRDSLNRLNITGTPDNIEYNAGNKRMNEFYDRLEPLFKQEDIEKKNNGKTSDSISSRINLIYDSLKNFQVDFVRKHPASMTSGIYVYLLQDNLPVNEVEDLYNSLQKPGKNISLLSALPQKIISRKRTLVGNQAPSFTMKDVDGKNVSFDNFKGKYVLLDFWASWCVPCRQQTPFIVSAYTRFKNKNFEIVSISLDDDALKWSKAIKKDQMNWINLSDLKGMNNEAAKLYGVQPIPDNFLIDPSGKIIERALMGEALEKKLETLLK